MTNISKEEMKQIRERVEKSTGGKWQYWGGDVYTVSKQGRINLQAICCLNDGENIENPNEEADAALIVNAREDITKLLAEIKRINEKIRELEGDVEAYAEVIDAQYEQIADFMEEAQEIEDLREKVEEQRQTIEWQKEEIERRI